MASPQRDWLTLAQAAALLGVHPSTLRRWANAGKVSVHLTPGGHRRFRRGELAPVVGVEWGTADQESGRVWGDYALVETRERLVRQPEPAWLAAFTPDHREEKRELGRRLMSIIMQHISAPDNQQVLLLEARSIAVRYAQNCEHVGLSACEGLEATLFFRDAMTEVALRMPQVAELDPDAQLRLLRKVNEIFNMVQITVVEYFDGRVGDRH